MHLRPISIWMKLTPRSSNTNDATKTVALNSELPIVDPILQHLESGKPPTSQQTNAPCTAEITKPTR
ncbi:4153_t:CDS:1, partial [Paraglomus occultum]